jgi:hypothetical protein
MSLEQRRRRHFIAGLRAVANFYEQNAEAYYGGMHITMTVTLLFPGSSVSR